VPYRLPPRKLGCSQTRGQRDKRPPLGYLRRQSGFFGFGADKKSGATERIPEATGRAIVKKGELTVVQRLP
jgi:hypothetical protein